VAELRRGGPEEGRGAVAGRGGSRRETARVGGSRRESAGAARGAGMPELPEVESARRLVERQCGGRRVERAECAEDAKVFCGPGGPREVEELLKGRRLEGTHRKGKQHWWSLSGGRGGARALGFQFGMTGNMRVRGVESTKYVKIKTDKDWPPRFTKLRVWFEGGVELAFCDSRRFARVRVYKGDPLLCPPVSLLGFDALDEVPGPEDFREALQARGAPVKAVLLDQKFSAGVGNWIADEVLYQARLHPEARCCDLTEKQVERVRQALDTVVRLACDAEADYTLFPDDWLFHYRWTGKKTSHDAQGNRIDFITVGSRTSAFVPTLQKKTDRGSGGAKRPPVDGPASPPKPPRKKKADARSVKREPGIKTERRPRPAAPGPTKRQPRAPAPAPAPAARRSARRRVR